MAIHVKEVLKFLFPEYQVMACVHECGFIAKTVPVPPQPMQRATMVSPAKQTDMTGHATYTPAMDDAKSIARANDAFDGLADALKRYWPGSEKDRVTFCRAYQRPYIRGFDNKKPRNAILLVSSDSGVYAVRGISELLWQKRVLRYAEVAVMDFETYVFDMANTIFLSDLYRALTSNTETVVFGNVDKASSAQMDVVYQLLREGSCQLPGQYMLAPNGGLVEAAGVLNAKPVTEIVTNGKFFVFTTMMPQAKVLSFLGNKFVRELGDIIALEPTWKDESGEAEGNAKNRF